MKTYGQLDQDETAYNTLLQHLAGEQPAYIIHHPRQPPDVRTCKGPNSLRVQAVMPNGLVITAYQPHPGARAFIKET